MITPTMRIAVLVPCFNEEAAVATVVSDFRKALPSAQADLAAIMALARAMITEALAG